MKKEHSDLQKWLGQAQFSRRSFLNTAALLGASSVLSSFPLSSSAAQAVPKRGGTLKLGMSGGNTSDTLDPTLFSDWVPLNQAYMLMNGLVEIDENNQATPELLESWQVEPGAKEWRFKVRQGVTFHNGKTLDADDIIYSINLHRGENSRSAIRSQLASITKLSRTAPDEIAITLDSGKPCVRRRRGSAGHQRSDGPHQCADLRSGSCIRATSSRKGRQARSSAPRCTPTPRNC